MDYAAIRGHLSAQEGKLDPDRHRGRVAQAVTSRTSTSGRPSCGVPPENRVERDDRRDLRENPTAEALPVDGKTPTFVVTQPHPSAMELRLPVRDSLPVIIQ